MTREEKRAEATESGVRKPIVLFADDEAEIRELLQSFCDQLGYRCLQAGNGEQALEMATGQLPDIVLLDAVMPGLNGFEVTTRLKAQERTKHIPVLILTGLKSRQDRLKAIAAGANDFLTKPVDLEELGLRLRNSLELKKYHDFLQNHAGILERRVSERTRELQQAFDDLKLAHEQIQETHRETIHRLAVASEYRDEDTGAHIRRISHYCRELASRLGMDHEYCDTIFYASVLHDIGKISIPDAILLKPAALTEGEWEFMKTHTTEGARMLAGSLSPYMRMGEEIAASHHERWNGGGYPRGLKGEQITLAARITHLADQYDALRSRRPYKPALDHRTVIKIINRGDARTSPEHFDPQLLAAFNSTSGRFEEIYAEFSDAQAGP